MSDIVNYTRDVRESLSSCNVLLAQGIGGNFLCLTRLDEVVKRADGKLARFELDYRWLSTNCESANDEAWVCVQGSEITYWQQKEVKGLLNELKNNGVNAVNIFDHFQLWC